MKTLIRSILPPFLLDWYHYALAFLGALLYGFPGSNMTVIGVTGTDGKSTTVEMITRILEEAGHKTCSTSSVWFQIGKEKKKNHLKMGMPGRMFLHRFLKKAKKAGCTYAVIEVSSEGILQHRHRFLNIQTAVITNLSPEHIERHGSFANYRATKQKLFQTAKGIHIVNGDDKAAPYFWKFPAREHYIYGLQKAPHLPEITKYISATNIEEQIDGTSFLIEEENIHLNLIGQFNTYNALAAISVAQAHGISLDICKRALEQMPRMPGRTEPVIVEPFLALVDYAVTPKALDNLYKGVKRLFKPKRMICVLGSCGGGRDKWRRPVLGEIASTYCDEIILTNEDPYDEDPKEIIDQIEEGSKKPVIKILDRREAIRKALSEAKEGDAVVMSGKGSEDAIAVKGGKKIVWNEKKVVEEELAKIDK